MTPPIFLVDSLLYPPPDTSGGDEPNSAVLTLSRAIVRATSGIQPQRASACTICSAHVSHHRQAAYLGVVSQMRNARSTNPISPRHTCVRTRAILLYLHARGVYWKSYRRALTCEDLPYIESPAAVQTALVQQITAVDNMQSARNEDALSLRVCNSLSSSSTCR